MPLITGGMSGPMFGADVEAKYAAWKSGTRFLHNGAVDTLEDLFCLDRARPSRSDEPFGDQGHTETCEGLSPDEKRALIASLRAN